MRMKRPIRNGLRKLGIKTTPVELMAVAGVVRGLTNSEIGLEIGVSQATIQRAIRRIMDSAGVDTKSDLLVRIFAPESLDEAKTLLDEFTHPRVIEPPQRRVVRP